MNPIKSKTTLAILASAVGFLSACQPSSSGKKVDPSLIYEFEYNGCNTGAHGFKTLVDYCDALRSNELNKGCALDLRAQEYANRCESQQQAELNVTSFDEELDQSDDL
ncbi:hypothetical protein DOM22_14700 [Bdellovibrio sp. ZAP7]|uniref:hypothetical protein n=1 Tax=Bdellovibrio sp. ZAP7 TaxID=2231053 RepID=UPI00115BEACE|nr:hypothetical protein [Bdellovibrio sp. ZAP7]QDK46326.1 hypothetical protein DOM22_14700 [Bdellovibrio sp. ZAP7]